MTTTPHGLGNELAVAQTAARDAGGYLVERLGSARTQAYKAARDAQLDVDLGAQALLMDAIHSAYPDDAILSEEADPPGETARRLWIIDPLDGSFNFQHGSAHFGVAIALRLDGVTKLGAIYLPVVDEMYTTIQGHGAYRNGAPVRVSETAQLSQALVHASDFAATGNPEDNRQSLQIMASLANDVGRVRMVGTAAGDFGWLADGRSDGLIMYSLWPWDIEAGALLVAEAGGIVTRETAPNGQGVYVGANRLLHRDLVALVSA